MKKYLLLAVILVGVFATVSAQTSPFNEYVGKYTFADVGSPVTEVTLAAEDTALVIYSAMGSSALQKKGVDTFYLAAYDATIVFKRSAEKAVATISIFVQGMELIGKKIATTTTGLNQEQELYQVLWKQKNELYY
jgi:hypothetical protein